MKNFVSDLLELRVKNDTFKLVFWNKDNEVVKELYVDRFDLVMSEDYKDLELLNLYAETQFIGVTPDFEIERKDIKVRSVIVLNVRQKEEK